MLYHPDLSEIRPITAKAVRAWPRLQSRIEKAEAILLNFALRYRGQPQNGWQVAGQVQADGTVACWYDVGLDGCTCIDYEIGHARADGRTFCKHSIAWIVYREILTDHMLAILEEATPFNGVNIRRINKHQEPIILQDGNCLHGAKFGKAALCIKYVYSTTRRRRQFATGADMAEFSHWLQAAQPALQAEAERQFVFGADAMALDAEVLPYKDWRALYMQEV